MSDVALFVKSDIWPRGDGKADWTVRVPGWDAMAVGVADDVAGAERAIKAQINAWAAERETSIDGELKVTRVKFDAVEE